MWDRANVHLAAVGMLVFLAEAAIADKKLPFLAAPLAQKECEGLSIAILDFNELAGKSNVTACSLADVTVNPDNGIIYRTSREGRDWLRNKGVAHNYSTHAQPWYLSSAIRASAHFTTNLDKADLVFVDDYCFYMSWLSLVHSGGYKSFPGEPDPGEAILKLYNALVALPRWKRRGGADFIMYDSHPGFLAGPQTWPVIRMQCGDMRNAITVVVDRAQRLNCGKNYKTWYNIAPRLIIAPYVANTAHNGTWTRAPPQRAARDTLVYAKETCMNYQVKAAAIHNAGKKMRHDVVYAMDSPNVTCVNRPGAPHLLYKDMLAGMMRSLYCLVVPGDSPSTRRLGEVFMAGCIPVFVGPPFNSMPFPHDLDYKEVAIVLNVTREYTRWLYPSEVVWDLKPPQQPTADQVFWTPDADVADFAMQIKDASDIEPMLAAIPRGEVDAKLAAVARVRRAFSFEPALSNPPNSANYILSRACRIHRNDTTIVRGGARGKKAPGRRAHAHHI